MLYHVFHLVLKMSGMASMIAIPLLLIKICLQKLGFPRRVTFLLWAVIAFRLVCPVSISTNFSLFNAATRLGGQGAATASQTTEATAVPRWVARYEALPYKDNRAYESQTQENKTNYIKTVLPLMWLSGMCTILLFGSASFVLLKRRLRFAIKRKENIYMAEGIPASFVFGIFRPKIFIPGNVRRQDLDNIVLHEKTHIKRADHIIKIMAFVLLSAYWFHPFAWLMFKIFSDDMEFACDEEVIRKIGLENKKQYLNTLLAASVNSQKTILFYNVCFSTNPTKRRIKNILRQKKHSRTVIAVGTVVCLFASLVFGTDAAEHRNGQNYAAAEQTAVPELNMEDAIPQIISQGDETQKDIYMSEGTETNIKPAAVVDGNEEKTIRNDNAAPKPVPEAIEDVQNNISEKMHMDDDIDFIQKVFEDNTQMTNVLLSLNEQGITQAKEKAVQLGENYILNNYSYRDNCGGVCSDISCNKDGNISIYFDVNAESLVDVTFTDSITQDAVAKFNILANNMNSYSFTGFSKEKSYDVTVQGKTEGVWKIEGQYVIY